MLICGIELIRLITQKFNIYFSIQFSSVQLLSLVWLLATPWNAARQASLSITNSWSSPRLTSIESESVMPSNRLLLCHPLLLLPSIFPSIRVFSNESALCIGWPKYWKSETGACHFGGFVWGWNLWFVLGSGFLLLTSNKIDHQISKAPSLKLVSELQEREHSLLR